MFETEKDKAFQKGLEEIEKKHWGFFENRDNNSPFDTHEKHDRLFFHHTTVHHSSGLINFYFNKESDLPEDIRKECVELFDSTYKQDS